MTVAEIIGLDIEVLEQLKNENLTPERRKDLEELHKELSQAIKKEQ